MSAKKNLFSHQVYIHPMLNAIIINRLAMRCLAMYAAFSGHYCNSRLEEKRIVRHERLWAKAFIVDSQATPSRYFWF